MGLDSRIFYVQQHSDEVDGRSSRVELKNWRDHERLNDWMMNLVLQKSRNAAQSEKQIMQECGFRVVLGLDDIEKLRTFFKKTAWPESHGDLSWIEKAKVIIIKGNTVYYDADW